MYLLGQKWTLLSINKQSNIKQSQMHSPFWLPHSSSHTQIAFLSQQPHSRQLPHMFCATGLIYTQRRKAFLQCSTVVVWLDILLNLIFIFACICYVGMLQRQYHGLWINCHVLQARLPVTVIHMVLQKYHCYRSYGTCYSWEISTHSFSHPHPHLSPSDLCNARHRSCLSIAPLSNFLSPIPHP